MALGLESDAKLAVPPETLELRGERPNGGRTSSPAVIELAEAFTELTQAENGLVAAEVMLDSLEHYRAAGP